MAKERRKSKHDPGGDDEMLIKTQVEAARFAGVDTRTIRRWKANGMPVTPEGWYIRPVLTLNKENDGRQVSKARQRSDEADADRKEYRAERERIELAQLKKDNDAVWERAIILKIVAIKRALAGTERKLPPLLEGKNKREIQKILHDEHTYIISIFSGQVL